MRNFFFFFNKKPSHLRGECRHQFRVLGEFKRRVDVAHEDWLCVREGTPLLGECPLHPNNRYYSNQIYARIIPHTIVSFTKRM
ncbi:hypothetical protein Hanom_Chr01g00004421 [Helianthus anomalus]